MNDGKNTHWAIAAIRDMGGLGLVLVMLVGLYVLADRYADNNESVLKEISEFQRMEVEELKQFRKAEQERIDAITGKLIFETNAKIRAVEERLERHVREGH